jgi:hypothetical protein
VFASAKFTALGENFKIFSIPRTQNSKAEKNQIKRSLIATVSSWRSDKVHKLNQHVPKIYQIHTNNSRLIFPSKLKSNECASEMADEM